MDEAIKEWRFEDAAVIRDQIKELEEGEWVVM
jgi:protein-arginine kinase activator protein McsA